MTLGKLLKLYNHYKNHYDFKLSGKSYKELDDMVAHDGEFIRDQEVKLWQVLLVEQLN